MKTVWYWNKDRLSDQWNKIEIPEIDVEVYQLVKETCQKSYGYDVKQ